MKPALTVFLRCFLSFSLLAGIYRSIFVINGFALGLDPPLFQAAVHAFACCNDFFINIVLATLLASVFIILGIFPQQLQKITFISISICVYVLCALIYFLNIKLATTIFMGVNYTMIYSFLHQPSIGGGLSSFLNTSDGITCFCLLLPIFFLLKNKIYNLKKIAVFITTFLFMIILLGAAPFAQISIQQPHLRFLTMYENPLTRVIKEAWQALQPYQKHTPTKIIKTEQSLQPALIHLKSNARQQSFNIVIFVMESVGAAYTQQTWQGQAVMPFLNHLKKQGAWYQNHYSSGNISALGQFSLFTGLYPYSQPIHYEFNRQLTIPTLANYLTNYDNFFVSASSDLYFANFINYSFHEYDNAQTMQSQALNFNMFGNEKIGFNFFLKRLQKSQHPFLAVFWSNAAHYPYFYNDQNHELKINPANPYQRYLNALRQVDHEIKQVYKYLKANKQIDRTIFIIVGDHGEMFGQHHGYVGHGRSLYQEEIQVPLLIYAPTLLKPLIIKAVTSSADIAPTLLDILQIQHPTLQGVSHLQNYLERVIFSYNDQNEIAAITQQKKMIISFASNQCTSYDLTNDPQEMQPISCQNSMMEQAILNFRNQQPSILSAFKNTHLNPLHGSFF